jgi:hypothetical protein
MQNENEFVSKKKKEANLSKCTIQWNLLVWKEG